MARLETPLARAKADLAPFAHAGSGVACFLHHRGDHHFAVGADGIGALVVVQSGAEWVAPGQQLAARRAAQRRGVAILKACATLREGVDVRGLERTAGAMDVTDAHVVGHD